MFRKAIWAQGSPLLERLLTASSTLSTAKTCSICTSAFGWILSVTLLKSVIRPYFMVQNQIKTGDYERPI